MSKLVQVGILLCLGYAASAGCVSDPGPEYDQAKGEDAAQSEEDTGESAQAISSSCATWYKTTGKVLTNYALTAPDANGFFSYSGFDGILCPAPPTPPLSVPPAPPAPPPPPYQDMRLIPGYLCPAQPDGSCAYNVGNGYGSISYVYPNQCPCNK
jgi:hypothetical protein